MTARVGGTAARRRVRLVVTELPMFPLGSVLFPGSVLPLHVFEERYRVLVRGLLERDEDERDFGVVLIERGSEVGGGDTRFDVGTRARMVRAVELDDGRYALVTVGVERVRVVEWLPDAPFPRGLVEPWPEPRSDADTLAARERVERILGKAIALWSELGGSAPAEVALPVDPVAASWQAAALAPVGPLDAQRLLEVDSAADRLARLEDLLTETLMMLRRRLDLPES